MILCEYFPRFKHSQEVATALWLLFHLFGIAANLYAYYVLKKKWNSMGNFSIILSTSILSNILALFVHLYLPINVLLRTVTGKEWSFGTLGCSLLSPFTNVTQAVAIFTLMAVAIQRFIKLNKNRDISFGEAENAMVLMFVTATLIVAPEFCQCGAITEPLIRDDICVPSWQVFYGGNLYQSFRVMLQYIIPFTVTANAFLKALLTPDSGKKTCLSRLMFAFSDCITIASIVVYIYFFPVKTIVLGEKQFTQQASMFPNIAGMMKAMDFGAIFCCIVAPFELIEIMTDDKMICETDFGNEADVAFSEKPFKKYLNDHSFIGELPDELTEIPAKVDGALKKDDISKEELFARLARDEPLKLKNEVIV